VGDKDRRFLKVDFNLLMSGTWVLLEKEAKLKLFEKSLNAGKVVISSPYGVPRVKDSKLLDFLIMTSQERDWSKVITFPSLSYLSRTCGFSSKRNFEELKKSLKLLKRLVIEFHNCFIDTGVLEHFGGLSAIVEIGVLQGYQVKKTKVGKSYPVRVVFDDNFLALCKHSLGYKLIPYAPIKGLRDTAYALYKWAWRWFNNEKGYGERWIGDGKKLVEWYKNELNSTAQYRYPAEVLRRVKSAIEQLNESNRIPFYLQLKQENGSYKIEVYRKEQCDLKRKIPFDDLPKVLREAVIKLIERKKHIKDPYALARSLSEKELETYTKKLETATVSKEVYELLADLEKVYGGKLGILSSQESGDRVQIAFEMENSTLKKWLDVVRSEEEVKA